eukprot:jgi/Botrbrau1/18443/Bobra.0072s0030.1
MGRKPRDSQACEAELQRLISSNGATDSNHVAVVAVRGMHCSSCSTAVEKALRDLPHVQTANVALVQGTAQVAFGGSNRDLVLKAILQAVEGAGFEADLLRCTSGTPQTEMIRIQVRGMHCGACSSAVEKALVSLAGVEKASVSLTLNQAEVEYTPALVTEDDLVTAIADMGFEAEVLNRGQVKSSDTLVLAIEGMTCSSCSSAVEMALQGVTGVRSAAVNLLAGRAEVHYNPDVAGPRLIVRAVEDAGFKATIVDTYRGTGEQERLADLERCRRMFFNSLWLTMPVFLTAMVLPLYPAARSFLRYPIAGFPLEEIIKWGFTTPIQFWIGWRFHAGAYHALRKGRANMDVLVSLGTNASYLYSIISILHHHFSHHHMNGAYKPTDFFETSAFLITFILLGKYLEASAKGRTSEAITKLFTRIPPVAILLHTGPDGEVMKEETVETSLIHRGDLLKVLPGARLPADGIVEEGTSYADESMLTGEAAPVLKHPGDTVIGGTVNLQSMLQVRATKVGSETALSQIVRLVENAQMSKAPIQAFADNVSSVFVPIVVATAFITYLCWYIAGRCHMFPDSWLPEGHNHFLFALLFGIAVLVIACPCALGLATPTAVMVGTGVAAQHGILIKGADALERAHNVRTVVFDKTGTLTLGHPVVTDHRIFDDQMPLEEALSLAAAVEAHSEHPLAMAVLNYASACLGMTKKLDSTNGGTRRPDGLSGTSGMERDVSWVRPANDVDVYPGMGVRGWVEPSLELRKAAVEKAAREAASLSRQAQTKPLASAKASRGWLDLLLFDSSLGSSGSESPAEAALRQPPGNSPRQVKVVVGNKKLMVQEDIVVPPPVDDFMREMEAECCTCVMIAVNMNVVACLAISDPLKPEARGVVSALSQRGIACWMVTGDNWRTARAISSALAITNVIAECLPDGKVDKIRDLQAGGKLVAMVGDGVNDAPALAQADVGIAIGSGTDVAMEAADYILMSSDLESVVVAIDLSQKTFTRIRLNYFWAMAYNVVMIPFAAGVLYPCTHMQIPPWVAGASMAFSSVSVVCSSLMLRNYQRPAPVLRDVCLHTA